MKFVIIKSSDLNSSPGCMLGARFNGECHDCIRVMNCKHDEAHQGRLTLLAVRRNRLVIELERVNKLLAEETNEDQNQSG